MDEPLKKCVFFVRTQAKTHLAPGFRVSYVEEREIITAKAI